MSDVTDLNALIERLERLRTARKAFHAAREAMNAARPNQDVTKATRAEYAVYDERYQADQDARRMAQSEAEQFAMWLTESNVTEALRTLAERQPVGDGEVTQADREAFASVCAGWWRNMKPEKIAEFARAGEIDNNELIQAFARHRQAAEQRGADRAFEEAAGIARGEVPLDVHEESPNYGLGHPRTDFDRGVARGREQAAAAIRQRIGGK